MGKNRMWIFIIGIIAVSIAIRLMSGSMDHSRIRKYVSQQGGKIISISWVPFGSGWFGEESARIYKVCYFDTQGEEHEAECKTSLFTGVYFTNDTIYTEVSRNQTPKKQGSSREAELALENKQLRDELDRIKNNKSNN